MLGDIGYKLEWLIFTFYRVVMEWFSDIKKLESPPQSDIVDLGWYIDAMLEHL